MVNSFSTEQPHVTLYLTAIASQSNLVKNPHVKVLFRKLWLLNEYAYHLIIFAWGPSQVFPENGLEVKLSGTAATGNPPTTLLPSTLLLDWRCIYNIFLSRLMLFSIITSWITISNPFFFHFCPSGVKARDTPYEVKITIPVEGYESIEFVLTKMCGKLPDFVFFNASFYQLLFFWNPFEYLSCNHDASAIELVSATSKFFFPPYFQTLHKIRKKTSQEGGQYSE